MFRRWFAAALLLGFCLCPATGYAHRVSPEVIAFFKVDGPRLHAIVRVPTAILGDARLPRRGATLLDLATVDGRLEAVATEVARNLDLIDRGGRLTGTPVQWRISVRGDRSFERYETAVAHLTGPRLPVERPVYWDEAFVDLQLDYSLSSGVPRVSARLNGLSAGSDFVQTRATYLPADGHPRVMTMTGPPQRVQFEPTLHDAIANVLGQAVRQMADAHLVWSLTACLAAAPIAAAAPVLSFLVAQAAGLALTAAPQPMLPSAALDVVLFIWGALTLLAAARVLVGGRPASLVALAALGGLAGGVWMGSRLHDVLSFGGSHRVAVVTAAIVLIAVLMLILFAFLQSLVRIARTWRAPAWLVTAAWLAVPAHEAAHIMMRTGAALAREDAWLLPSTVAALSRHAPLWAALSFVAILWLITRARRPLSPSGGATT